MWNTQLGKIIRWIIYLPLAILSILIIYVLFIYAVSTGVGFFFSSWWKFLLVFVCAGIVWELIKIVSMYLSFFVVAVCPNKLLGGLIMSIIATTIFGFLLYKIWSIQYGYPFKVIILCAIVSVLIIKLWSNIILASTKQYETIS